MKPVRLKASREHFVTSSGATRQLKQLDVLEVFLYLPRTDLKQVYEWIFCWSSERISQQFFQRISQQIFQRISKRISSQISKQISEHIFKQTTKNMSRYQSINQSVFQA